MGRTCMLGRVLTSLILAGVPAAGTRAQVIGFDAGAGPRVVVPCDGRWSTYPDLALDGVARCAMPWDRDGPGPEPEVLVVGGNFTHAGTQTVNCIAAWDGVHWSALGTGMFGSAEDRGVYALAVHGGALIAGGLFESAGSVSGPNVAAWDGSAWRSMGGGLGGKVLSLAVYGGSLYAAGWELAHDGPFARWDGNRWHVHAGHMLGWPILAMTPFNGELAAGGLFQWLESYEEVGKVAAWNGSAWHGLGPGIVGQDGEWRYSFVAAMCAYEGSLYAGGVFLSDLGAVADNLARWDGASWSAVGDGMPEPSNIWALTEYAGTLIVGGGGAWRWDGTAWSRLGDGFIGGNVQTLVPYKGGLFVGGEFDEAGGLAAGNWALWTVGPSLLTEPADSGACVGGSITLGVEALSDLPMDFVWRRNTIPLSDGGTGNGGWITGASSPVLTITGVEKADMGGYDCVVSDACGSITSTTAAVTVCMCLECAADFNQDGGIDGADVDAFFGAWEIGNCDADVNADGGTDGADVDAFFAAWEAGGCG